MLAYCFSSTNIALSGRMARMASRRVLNALPHIVLTTVSIHAVAAERVQKQNISLPIVCPKCPQSLRNPGPMFEFLVFDKQEVILFRVGCLLFFRLHFRFSPNEARQRQGGAVLHKNRRKRKKRETAPPLRCLVSFGEKRKCRRKSRK